MKRGFVLLSVLFRCESSFFKSNISIHFPLDVLDYAFSSFSPYVYGISMLLFAFSKRFGSLENSAEYSMGRQWLAREGRRSCMFAIQAVQPDWATWGGDRDSARRFRISIVCGSAFSRT